MKVSPLILLAALFTLAFTLATALPPHITWQQHNKSNNVFGLMFGDGRKLFANQFFTMADVYFHSGYYPSIFEGGKKDSEVTEASRGHADDPDEEEKEDFFGQPKDWIDAFGRNFRITHHTHLEKGKEREILPWLRLAAEMDPQKIETYTVGAYYLRAQLGQLREAELFLREGLRNNPGNCEILFELGRLYHEGDHDLNRARNVWELAVKKFTELPAPVQKDSQIILDEIIVNLGYLENEAKNFPQAINWLEAAKSLSPAPAALQKQIDDIRTKMAAQNSATNSVP